MAVAKQKSTGTKRAAKPKKYGPKASESVARELHALDAGTLRSGSGKIVTTRKQAIAIGLDEARRAGAKVPPNPNDGKKSG